MAHSLLTGIHSTDRNVLGGSRDLSVGSSGCLSKAEINGSGFTYCQGAWLRGKSNLHTNLVFGKWPSSKYIYLLNSHHHSCVVTTENVKKTLLNSGISTYSTLLVSYHCNITPAFTRLAYCAFHTCHMHRNCWYHHYSLLCNNRVIIVDTAIITIISSLCIFAVLPIPILFLFIPSSSLTIYIALFLFSSLLPVLLPCLYPSIIISSSCSDSLFPTLASSWMSTKDWRRNPTGRANVVITTKWH